MRTKTGIVTLTGALMALAVATAAYADGKCVKGFRDTTPAERATMMAAPEAAKQALPGAPASWVIQGDEQITAYREYCLDFIQNPWGYGIGRSYQRNDDAQARGERDKVMADASASYTASMAGKQARLDAIMARISKLGEQGAAAAQKGDTALALAINAEAEKAQAEYQKVADEGDAAQQIDAAGEKAGRDMEMRIDINVNENPAVAGDGATSLPLPSGARAAFRWSIRGGSIRQDEALVLFGEWQPGKGGAWQAVPRPKQPMSAPHVTTVHVIADASRLAAALKVIDFNSLAKLVSK